MRRHRLHEFECTYTAKEVVPTIDARFRTVARQDARAIGGLSMGGHGAMQLALNFPGIWSTIGAYTWYIDSGDVDPWRAPAGGIADALAQLGIAREWHPNTGDHSALYWTAQMEDYVRFYARALCGTRTCG